MDRKTRAALLASVAIVVIGFGLSRLPTASLLAPDHLPELDDWEPGHTGTAEAVDALALSRSGTLVLPPPLLADPDSAPEAHVREAGEAALRERFNQAAVMLHAGEYDYAIKALHGVLALAPRLPEAHVNMGFALLGSETPGPAADFFATAIELNPYQANAYYGLAMASEVLGEREAALGAMRSFIHLAGDAEQPYLPRARAALWEWQAAAEAERALVSGEAFAGAEAGHVAEYDILVVIDDALVAREGAFAVGEPP
ncbi:tetratricopeptide repeat protein [Halomonas alkalisoli]|uniref:tetratricopeptide repeat protein n=1 Tax=Halomonas alkalisoli TaxID=2907158 RepID=UPI001F41C55C|nr:tetratricopeptide repeat protein [Halomonas alkalisoli]MCE9682594.1 tetratricopeptide repeat protein [Halomonas alkalisoli]